jgi:membrane-bound lytic murein transglycosylase B
MVAGAARAEPAFDAFLQSTWPQAQALGVSRATFDAATRGLEPDLSLPDLALPGRQETAPQQPEFVQTPVNTATRWRALRRNSACPATWC